MFEKRVAIAVAVAVICALVFCNAAPVIQAKTPSTTVAAAKTTLTILAPSLVPVRQSFSISGQLTSNGAPFTRSIVYLQRFNGNTWTNIAMKAVTGTYSFTLTEITSNTYQYRTTYAGSATYASATSPVVQVQVRAPTQLSAAANLTSVLVNQNFTINGRLKTTTGEPVSGATVQLQTNVSGTWTNVTAGTNTTTSAGAYSISINESATGTYQFQTTYAGNDVYSSSTSSTATVTIKPAPTATPPAAKTTVKQATTTPTPTLDPTPTPTPTQRNPNRPTPTPSAATSTGNTTALAAVTVVQGQNFTIPLQSNPSTGYHWEPQFDSTALSLTGSVFVSGPNPNHLVGVPGSQNFTFQGITQGTSVITFNNISPSNQTANSVTASVTVTAAAPTPTPSPTPTPTPVRPPHQSHPQRQQLNSHCQSNGHFHRHLE